MRDIIGSIEAEYRRYKALGEGALRQVRDEELAAPGPNGGSSITIIVWHVAGNLASRFTAFLTSDGEKPWRKRDEEFTAREVSRAELVEKWERGWTILLDALAPLTDAHLVERVTIRGEGLTVDQALHRSLAHTAYHVGQIVYLAKSYRGDNWVSLSIPPGQSDAYNSRPATMPHLEPDTSGLEEMAGPNLEARATGRQARDS